MVLFFNFFLDLTFAFMLMAKVRCSPPFPLLPFPHFPTSPRNGSTEHRGGSTSGSDLGMRLRRELLSNARSNADLTVEASPSARLSFAERPNVAHEVVSPYL